MFEEEIRKILDDEPIKMYPSIEDARRAIRKRHKELAHQICQLVVYLGQRELEPKPEYDASITQLPDPFEPKADEGRLLLDEEMVRAFEEAKLSPFANAYQERCVIARAQDAKSYPIGFKDGYTKAKEELCRD